MLALEPGEQRLIRLFKKTLEGALLLHIQCAVVLFQKASKQQIEFQQTAPTLPAQTPHSFIFGDTHSTRLSSNWRI